MKKTDTSFVHTYIEWNNTFELQFKTSKESKSQCLQFQILHRSFKRMDTYFKLNLNDLPACSFCNQYIIIDHFFDDCFYKREMWHYFEERIRSKFSLLMAFDKQTILFGKFKKKKYV